MINSILLKNFKSYFKMCHQAVYDNALEAETRATAEYSKRLARKDSVFTKSTTKYLEARNKKSNLVKITKDDYKKNVAEYNAKHEEKFESIIPVILEEQQELYKRQLLYCYEARIQNFDKDNYLSLIIITEVKNNNFYSNNNNLNNWFQEFFQDLQAHH